MKCIDCGKEITEGRVCAECMGIDEERRDDTADGQEENDTGFYGDDSRDVDENDSETREEREYEKKIKHFEDGSCVAPETKKGEKNILHWRNPMLREFFLTLALGALFVIIDLLLFKSVSENVPNALYYFICCTAIALGLLVFAFVFRMPRAFKLDRMQRGKNLRARWTLSKDEVEDAANEQKNKNRLLYILVTLASLALLIYSIATHSGAVDFFFLLVTIASAVVALIFGFLFFFMPKYNYQRVVKNGRDVLIGEESVFVYGKYYYFSNVDTKLTYAHINTKRHIMTIEFAVPKKDGGVTKKNVEVYVPDNAEKKALALIDEYESSVKRFRESGIRTADEAVKK